MDELRHLAKASSVLENYCVREFCAREEMTYIFLKHYSV